MKYFSVFLICLVILVLIGCAVILFFPDMLPAHLTGANERLSLAQLLIGGASLATLMLAAWEFRQSQRSPKLRLRMADLTGDKLIDTKAVSYELRLKEELKRVHEANCENGTVAKYYLFEVALLLENLGNAAAKWIKISVEVKDSRPPTEAFDYEVIGINLVTEYLLISEEDFHTLRALRLYDPGKYYCYSMPTSSLLFRRSQQDIGKWIPSEENAHTTKHVFYGGDDFVSFSCPKSMNSSREGMDEIGTFVLLIPAKESEDHAGLPLQITCHIESDGFPRMKQELKFKI
jgi:hypothetical protein